MQIFQMQFGERHLFSQNLLRPGLGAFAPAAHNLFNEQLDL
jgi:hypothetical protein